MTKCYKAQAVYSALLSNVVAEQTYAVKLPSSLTRFVGHTNK